MASMNVSLPDPMRDWIATKIEGGQYATASDYVRDLIRRDKEKADHRAELIAALEKGERSGISQRQVPEIVAALRAELAGEAE